mgnify:CR=1 FL=1
MDNLPADIVNKIYFNLWCSYHNELEKEIRINYVLKHFKQMCKDTDYVDEIIESEKIKLTLDSRYYMEWCSNYSDWLLE